jgi:glutamate dehydrogenase/leucine dehydrogenase
MSTPTVVNDTMAAAFSHEQVLVRRGSRAGLPIIVALHSTVLGTAVGGCRLAQYPDWRDGLDDALRLSAAMTDKCAVAGLPNGGGKTVIALRPGQTLDPAERRSVLLDVGDLVAGLGGIYATGPDVGTGPDDMIVIAERTAQVFGRPIEAGGGGDSSVPTATGVLAALPAVCAEAFGSARLAGRRFAVVGLGHVGSLIARRLAEAGAELVVSDVDQSKRGLAQQLGAVWLDPEHAVEAEVDVLVPAALGGLLTPASVPRLRCAAIAGPANNQLDQPGTAELLQRRGILWAPDFVVNAGGAIHLTAVELHHETVAQVTARVEAIADTLAEVFRTARETGVTPAGAARDLARRRLQTG